MTDYITPQEAQELLDGATPGPWTAWGIMRCPDTPVFIAGPGDDPIASSADEPIAGTPTDTAGAVSQANAPLIVAAPDLAATIAADTIEYAYLYRDEGSDTWNMSVGGFKSREGAEAERRSWLGRVPDERVKLVARRVSPTWKVDEND